MALRRNYSRYAAASNGQVYLYRSVAELLSSHIERGIHCAVLGDTALEFLFIPRDSRNLIIIFHAAANPQTLTLPIFVGLGITKDLDASIMVVSDPALEYSIPTGWFVGSEKIALQRKLKIAIRHVAKACGADNVIFQGASAGGFAAMQYSASFPGSLAVAINPQTDLSSHYPERVQPYLDVCWGGSMPSDAAATTNLLSSYSTRFDNFILYVQNEQDTFHLKNHYHQWAKTFDDVRGERWSLLSGDWGPGHAAPPPFFQTAILEYALTFNGKWGEFLHSEEFS